MFLSDHDISSLYRRGNKSLGELFEWFCVNKLSLNANKTQFIIIHQSSRSKNVQSEHELLINGTKISRTYSCKFLGITIDESLTWRRHLACVNKKISNALFVIKQLKFSLPKESLRLLYYSLLHPHLMYGILAWGNAGSSVISKTEMIQKRAMRTIHNKHYKSHSDPLFRQSGVLKVSDLYQLEVLLFMHDYMNDKLPSSFQNSFTLNYDVQESYITRQSNMFNIPMTKSRFVDRLPLIQFPIIWNKHAKFHYSDMSEKAMKNSFKSARLAQYATNVICSNSLYPDCKINI